MPYGQPIPWLDWRPDDDPRRPGVIADVDGFWPTTRGMVMAPNWVDTGATGIPDGEVVTGGVFASFSAGGVSVNNPTNRMLIVGTMNHLYKLQSVSDPALPNTWVVFDLQTVSGGANPNFGTDPPAGTRWRFAVWENRSFPLQVIVAVDGYNWNQISVNGGPFQPMIDSTVPPFGGHFSTSGTQLAPAKLVETVDQGMFLANFSVGPGSTLPKSQWNLANNQWIFSVNPTQWVQSIAAECVSDYLVATQGPIVAMHRIRGGVVMYKPTSFYMGVFGDPQRYWDFGAVSETIGATATPSALTIELDPHPTCQELVVNTGDVHVWFGGDNFYQFDSSSLQPVQNAVKETFTKLVPPDGITEMRGEYLVTSGIVRWYYPNRPEATDQLLAALLYGVRAGQKWLTTTPQAVVNGVLVPLVIQAVIENYGVIAALVNTTQPLLFREVAPPVRAFWVSGEMGDATNYYQLSRMRLTFAELPPHTQATAQGRVAVQNGQTPTPTTPPVQMQLDGSINLIQTGRVHSVKFILTASGDLTIEQKAPEVTAVLVDMQVVGEE